ncbi:hypothetical protein FACS1894206_07200 [Deltaproteobacteria bacterium]|nr:hypothetical protein FACS1894206_07200 [Deltaproteobacteria bacterium]
MDDVPRLHIRLRSCLQTILELEPELQTIEMAEPLLAEFSVLKGIYNKLETLLIFEDDVRRIEEATAHFLEEIQYSVSREGYLMHSILRVLQ